MWSASVERPCESDPNTAAELLALFGYELDDQGALVDSLVLNTKGGGNVGTKVVTNVNLGEVSPSLIYAVAAVLEGCNFVNGGSQNTVCRGLVELCATRGTYVLGTDFKAGQTKFKTAALEYIRALGLEPRVMSTDQGWLFCLST